MAKPLDMPIPTSAPSGSIKPDAAAISAEVNADSPVVRSASATASPSGMS